MDAVREHAVGHRHLVRPAREGHGCAANEVFLAQLKRLDGPAFPHRRGEIVPQPSVSISHLEHTIVLFGEHLQAGHGGLEHVHHTRIGSHHQVPKRDDPTLRILPHQTELHRKVVRPRGVLAALDRVGIHRRTRQQSDHHHRKGNPSTEMSHVLILLNG